MHVLAVEPYFGGSHEAFLESVIPRSRHEWTRLTGPARHWKWRMRNAPLALSRQLSEKLANNESHFQKQIDVVFCSDMLDLAQWRGFLCGGVQDGRFESSPVARALNRIAMLPAITYFHENQWTYPRSPLAREDAHYGYTNLLTAIASDEVWFNSAFHREEFLRESRKFVARMPDGQGTHDLDRLADRSVVIPPGFEAVGIAEASPLDSQTSHRLRIGWASRWEYDKRPDRFELLLAKLSDLQVDFELILLGNRPAKPSPHLKSIQQQYADRILYCGFAESRSLYRDQLRKMDVIVSTADHEFFGIAICEAISAGAIPVLPDALSYPELVRSDFRYRSLDEAADMIKRWSQVSDRQPFSLECREQLRPFRLEEIVSQIDEGIERVMARRTRHNLP